MVISSFVLIGCQKKREEKKELKKENVSLAISGMTCEISCAKTIQSKLSKKEGVLSASVIFKDSIANIEFDANTTSKQELMAFVNGIAGGELYRTSISNKKESHICTSNCKENCQNNTKEEKSCKQDCKMACCADKVSIKI